MRPGHPIFRFVLDEFKLCDFEPDEIKKLCDLEHPTSIHARHNNATIPAEVPRVLTCNATRLQQLLPGSMTIQDFDAVCRRITAVGPITADLRRREAV